jgi:hypothetical protein
VELAGTAFLKVHFELEKLRNVAQRFTQPEFNKLTAEYAKKALDFIVIQYAEPGTYQSENFKKCICFHVLHGPLLS